MDRGHVSSEMREAVAEDSIAQSYELLHNDRRHGPEPLVACLHLEHAAIAELESSGAVVVACGKCFNLAGRALWLRREIHRHEAWRLN